MRACVVAFPLPADPTQPGGAAGEEAPWKPVDVNITSCPPCARACQRRGVFPSHPPSSFPGMGGHPAAMFIN